jgi:hypothetical protein
MEDFPDPVPYVVGFVYEPPYPPYSRTARNFAELFRRTR